MDLAECRSSRDPKAGRVPHKYLGRLKGSLTRHCGNWRYAPSFYAILVIMPISARNQLEGKVVEVNLGDIMAHVVVRIGKSQIESVITRRSAEQLGLKKGDKVTVVIKSTEVMLVKD
jgi:molybdopterin-binding protein